MTSMPAPLCSMSRSRNSAPAELTICGRPGVKNSNAMVPKTGLPSARRVFTGLPRISALLAQGQRRHPAQPVVLEEELVRQGAGDVEPDHGEEGEADPGVDRAEEIGPTFGLADEERQRQAEEMDARAERVLEDIADEE